MKRSYLSHCMAALLVIASTGGACARNFAVADTASRGTKLHGDAARGQTIVERWCANCHSMGVSADDRTPSLRALAGNPAKPEGYIRAFLMRPHAPMPPLNLTTQEIEDVVSYLRNLKDSPR